MEGADVLVIWKILGLYVHMTLNGDKFANIYDISIRIISSSCFHWEWVILTLSFYWNMTIYFTFLLLLCIRNVHSIYKIVTYRWLKHLFNRKEFTFKQNLLRFFRDVYQSHKSKIIVNISDEQPVNTYWWCDSCIGPSIYILSTCMCAWVNVFMYILPIVSWYEKKALYLLEDIFIFLS